MWHKGLFLKIKDDKMQTKSVCLYTRLLSKTWELLTVLLNQKCMCEGLSKISSNFTLHLIKVAKLKQFKKVLSNLKIILVSNLTDLWFLELWKRWNMSINLNYSAWKNSLKLTWSKKRIGCVWSFILLEVIKIYLSWNILAFLGSNEKTNTVYFLD